jgi:hypothetical protein
LTGQQGQLDLEAVLVDGVAEGSAALRTRYWTLFLCRMSRSAVAL